MRDVKRGLPQEELDPCEDEEGREENDEGRV